MVTAPKVVLSHFGESGSVDKFCSSLGRPKSQPPGESAGGK